MSLLIPAFLAVFALIVLGTVGTIIRTLYIVFKYMTTSAISSKTGPQQKGVRVDLPNVSYAVIFATVVTSLAAGMVFVVIPKLADFATNGFPPQEPVLRGAPESSWTFAAAEQKHKTFDFVADLHADTFLWPHRGSILNSTLPFGYVDVPRMLQGNVALQVFATVTQVPAMQNMETNSNITDITGLLHFAQQYPYTAWFSSFYRVIAQGKRLEQTAASSGGKLIMVKSRSDLDTLLKKRKNGEKVVGGLLCIEGAQAFEGDVNKVDQLFDAGVRMFGVSHFVDTLFGGSAHGSEKYGITAFGKKAIERVIERSMIIDLAHASVPLFWDIIEIVKQKRADYDSAKHKYNKPTVIVSHTGVKGTVDTPRNLDDKQIKAVAELGGTVGVTFFKEAIGDISVPHIVKTIKYVVDVIGVDHVSLGSDYDGSVRCGLHVGHFAHLTHQLLAAGFSVEDAEKIMGSNARRVFEEMLPK
jgi:microsomal dipeptidase-like Zn-dependent dipeptidase